MPKINNLVRRRARFLGEIRNFFAERNVFEVDTPHLAPGGNPDPNLEHFELDGLYLNTSPEFYLKRLLAGGSGDIYQLSHVFRKNEQGKLHAREFMMLEWYRLGFDMFALMAEVKELIRCFVPDISFTMLSFEELFARLGGAGSAVDILRRNNIDVPQGLSDDEMLDLVLAAVIEPKLKHSGAVLVYDYPPSRASLAKINRRGKASRFELFINGVEIANGFDELQDAAQQKKRFIRHNESRKKKGLPAIKIDDDFLRALKNGLPQCSGVALGVDRLMMIAWGQKQLTEVMLF